MSQYEKQIVEGIGYLTEAVRDTMAEVSNIAKELRRSRNVMIDLEALKTERDAILARCHITQDIGRLDEAYFVAETMHKLKED